MKRGFTLIESMLVAALFLVLLSSTFVVYTAVSRNDHFLQALHGVETNGRFLVLFFQKKLGHLNQKNCVRQGVQRVPRLTIFQANHRPIWLKRQAIKGEMGFITALCGIKTAYYVARTSRKLKGHFVLALYQKQYGKRRIELVPDVYNMLVSVGVKKEGGKFVADDTRRPLLSRGEVVAGLQLKFMLVSKASRILRATGLGEWGTYIDLL